MSMLHRRREALRRAQDQQAAPAAQVAEPIPAWVDLVKKSDQELWALAQQHGITRSTRMATLSALNKAR